MVKVSLLVSLAGLSLIDAKPIKLRAADGKRGLAYNVPALTNLFSAGKVSWQYNWVSTTADYNKALEYVPMLHANETDYNKNWFADVKTAVDNGAKHVLSFNEPDQCGGGGACMQNVTATAEAHQYWVQSLLKDHPDLKIGAPAVTNGDSSTPGAEMGLPYLKSFLAACTGCQIDFVAPHWYDSAQNVEYFKSHLQQVHEETKKPLWVTEFGVTSGDAQAFLSEVLPWMDQQDYIERYAYQWVNPGVLVSEDSKSLSALGNVYAST